jgi:bifunctional DNA-binding transcriptional regulator/antitoxin component of YhaV-PrlF toxin-antitoxin module
VRKSTNPGQARLLTAAFDAPGSFRYPYFSMREVRKRRRGFTRISAKHQATIPVQALKEAGLKPGDELRVVADGRGRLVLERDVDLVERHAGSLPGVYPPGELETLRGEWR